MTNLLKMDNRIDSIFQEINGIVARNLNNYKTGNPVLIDSSFFNEIYCEASNISTCEEHTKSFDALLKIKKLPVLYWFTIDDSTSASFIREKYIEFKSTKSLRSSSAYTKHVNHESKTLYVGKVKKDFHLRLVTHLGYSKNKDTAGMQLFHWYDPIQKGQLYLNYIVFEDEMKDLITILEMEMARKLKPIIGKY